MAETKKENPVFAKSKEQVAAEKDANDAAVVKYKNEALANRAARFSSSTTSNPMSQFEIRQARQAIIDPKTVLLNPESANTVKPIDNPIPVRHNAEEPGEPDKSEPVELVKVREENESQPEGHRVPPELQLNGESGGGGVMPVESRARQMHPLAPGVEKLEENAPEKFATLQTVNDTPEAMLQDSVAAKAVNNPDGAPLDPEGKGKGLKTLSDGSTIDAEGDKHSQQPEGHQPPVKVEEEKPVDRAQEDLDAARERYKAVFGKPANARWSTEHIDKLISEKE